MPKLVLYRFNNTDYIGKTPSDIHNNIIKDSKRLKLSPPTLETVSNNSSPYNTGGPRDYVAPVAMGKKLSMTDIINGAKAIVRLQGGSRVDNEEMERRAGICKYAVQGGCPKLSEVAGCASCAAGANISSWLSKLKNFFGGEKLVIPNNLGDMYCSCCGCSLAIMIPSKMESFDFEKDNQKDRPKHCWLKKGGENFIES